jgi:FHA domain-containing protein
MRFSIVKNKSGQVPPQSSCDFLPPGGTIGRSVDNNLVLPDEERAISRLQAIVHISADGECRITNRGNVTRVLLNDIPLERGRQVELQDGDVLGIDDYQIEVSALHQHAAPQAQPVAKAAAAGAVRRFICARVARDAKQQRSAGAADGRRRAAGSAG